MAPRPTAERISKTIISIDSTIGVHRVATYLRNALVAKTVGSQLAYSTREPKQLNVFIIVEEFYSRVAETDKTKRYEEFLKPDSKIRIMAATTSLCMGMNVSDVGRVVICKFPIGRDFADLWQKAGRGGRGKGRRSMAFAFLPYWIFKDDGVENPELSKKPKTRAVAPRRGASQLHRVVNIKAVDDAASVESDAASEASDATDVTDTTPLPGPSSGIATPWKQRKKRDGPPKWNAKEMKQQNEMPKEVA